MELNINGKKKGGSVLCGLLVFVIGIILLWWNEGRTVETEGAIAEFEESYIEVDSSEIDSANDGKNIYSHGELNYDEKGATDSEFSVTVDSAVLQRTVEMFQWKESCTTDSNDNETCTYSEVWSDEFIDSTGFESGHENPTTKKYDTTRSYAEYIKMGAFDMDYFKESFSTEVGYNDLSEEVATSKNLYIASGYYTTVETDTNPEIGDVRIKFTYNNAKELSAIGTQNGKGIVVFTASNGHKVAKMNEANVTSENLIQQLRDENNLWKWILRAVGTLMIIGGLISIISPIQKLASYIPLLGKVFNTATSFVMGTIGLLISLLVIAIAWFRYRPVLSIILILIGVGAVVLAKQLKGKKKRK